MSQSSAVTYKRCGRQFYMGFIVFFILFLMVKKCWDRLSFGHVIAS